MFICCTHNFKNVYENGDSACRNPENVCRNSTSKVKESKEKEREGKESKEDICPEPEQPASVPPVISLILNSLIDGGMK